MCGKLLGFSVAIAVPKCD